MKETKTEPGERRPIASRETKGARWAARVLVSVGATPNLISVLGMVAGMLAGVAFYGTTAWPERAWVGWVAGAALVQLRLLANMFDGMVAMETGTASPVGELYNEVPDRVSDAFTLIGFGYAFGSDVALGYVAACLALFVAYVRAMGKAAGGKQEFCGPMAKPQRMFLITLAALYCGLTPGGWQPADPGLASWTLGLIIAGSVLTALRRLLRTARTLRERSSS